MDEGPRRGLCAGLAWHLDERRRVIGERPLEHGAQRIRGLDPESGRSKAFGQLDEVGISQALTEVVAVERGFLIPEHVAEAAIVEHDGYGADPMLHGGSQLLDAEHEAAIAVD